ncbi:neuraminidase-like domain-containing protein [Pseudomonas sp. SAICEU22]|uniref:Neuraminidase-like domain-containing protein n=1 Tax=Pseudomonas agronomica TaxID=2979328 RepID=A0ABT3F423_9PSED|nr:neuraminidase-like domain-containing protein [Pseudomonas agronomica]MCW1243835.1 neuraminidase-like domain-containing protein [Pseudomonas agronomica]
MTVAMKKQLDESLRDAQLAFYLHKISPGKSLPGTVRLKTARDLYEYWLLDVLVSQDVPTTPVACAIASLQQYINRILMNIEPGYDQASITPEHLQTWRNEMHQYPIWAAHQNLLYFPASYLDPTLRNNKSDNFQQLENDLNQNRIQPEAVQSAVMAYLTRFEEIANLNVLNGYIDRRDFANSTYYFIAKSRTENTYFWRSLNMAQRPPGGTQPDPLAWSDWEKADVPIPDSAVEHSIRPVWFNNRLFVVWAECIHQDPSASSAPSSADATASKVNHPLLRLSYCFKKQNGIWSAPRVGLQGYCSDKALVGAGMDGIRPLVGTVAIPHRKDASDVLFFALCAYKPEAPLLLSADDFIFISTTYIDKSLHSARARLATTGETAKKEHAQCDSDEKHHLGPLTFRFQAQRSLPLKITYSDAPLPTGMSRSMSNTHSYQEDIIVGTIDNAKSTSLTLRLSTTPDSEVSESRKTIFRISSSLSASMIQLSLAIPAGDLPNTTYVKLGEGSEVFVTAPNLAYGQTHTLSFGGLTDVLRNNLSHSGFSLYDETDLEGRFISTDALRYLENSGLRASKSNNKFAPIDMKLNPINSPSGYDFASPTLELIRPLHIRYIILCRTDTSKAITYENLTTIAESPASYQLSNSFDHTLDGSHISDGDILFCGVALVLPGKPGKKISSALKAIKVNIVTSEPLPNIICRSTPGLGAAQYIDFTNSASESHDVKRQPIRLNTLFAPELIRRTENSLDELFNRTTQRLPEPTIPGSDNNQMDFHGPYGRYFTELFLHLPWLVAHRLNAEQRYEEAERWLRRLFDPGLGKESCWKAVPLLDSSTPSYADQAPHDPHQIALSHPVHFRKALYFLYLDILINRGDAAYRELTPDGLSEAKLWYVRVLDLLGPRPIVQPIDHWASIKLQTLSEATSEKLRTYEGSVAYPQSSLTVREGNSQASLPAIDSPHLRLPFHPQLLRCWDVAESRLHNLRHNLDIAGKPLHLPVFAVPLDPRALLSASVLNTSNNTVQGLPTTSIPHYRFSVMHSQALGAVESLSQFGAVLLSLIERKEQAQFQAATAASLEPGENFGRPATPSLEY